MGIARENLKKARSKVQLGLQAMHTQLISAPKKGEVFITVTDAKTGEIQDERHVKNVVTLDASLLVARLTKDPQEPANGINMLAVGTGALGAILNPDAPPATQRRLNNEIFRKTFSETTFRNSEGAASAIPTNIVDFTTIYAESEAVGALNEMGLLSTISNNNTIINNNPNFAGQGGAAYDPTIDVTNYDILCNYLTFSVITKPPTAILTITWRLTY